MINLRYTLLGDFEDKKYVNFMKVKQSLKIKHFLRRSLK